VPTNITTQGIQNQSIEYKNLKGRKGNIETKKKKEHKPETKPSL